MYNLETWVVGEAETYLQRGGCSLDILVVYSQSFGMAERIKVLGLRSCHRRKVILSTIHVLDLYRVGYKC